MDVFKERAMVLPSSNSPQNSLTMTYSTASIKNPLQSKKVILRPISISWGCSFKDKLFCPGAKKPDSSGLNVSYRIIRLLLLTLCTGTYSPENKKQVEQLATVIIKILADFTSVSKLNVCHISGQVISTACIQNYSSVWTKYSFIKRSEHQGKYCNWKLYNVDIFLIE